MIITKEKHIGKIVAEDYRTAQIFKNHKIDFCCQGNRSIEIVCENKSFTSEELIGEIEAMQQKHETSNDYKSWPLDLLADYIEKKHHRYVEEGFKVLIPYLNKLCKVHGGNHPELFEITKEFKESAVELGSHMEKEENVLFPFIRTLVQAKHENSEIEKPHFGTVENPVEMMMQDHEAEGERFRKIADLSNNYTPPEDACNTYRVSFALLNEFEQDLHLHIHLENNILFPKAIALEKELNG
ncbi:MAG: iron-sulfur cluster repair di-iron protein [Flavobacteriaceae bacterium]|nr:iron-sulfur cluster repair di-iron protein [Flavobacteriaceae bacterium]